MCKTTESGLHPFQQSGLGTAPFSYAGCKEVATRLPDGSTRAAGSCDHCGACIRWAFGVKSADGRVSFVGSDCICKLNREDNRFIGAVEAEVRKIKKVAGKKSAAARKEKQISYSLAGLTGKVEVARLLDRIAG